MGIAVRSYFVDTLKRRPSGTAMTITINESALKHRISREDILKAMALPLVDRLMPEYLNKYLLLGFAGNGQLLEIMYNIRDDGSCNVFHAMKCRKAFYHLAEESGYYV